MRSKGDLMMDESKLIIGLLNTDKTMPQPGQLVRYGDIIVKVKQVYKWFFNYRTKGGYLCSIQRYENWEEIS